MVCFTPRLGGQALLFRSLRGRESMQQDEWTLVTVFVLHCCSVVMAKFVDIECDAFEKVPCL